MLILTGGGGSLGCVDFNEKSDGFLTVGVKANKAGHTATPVACGWAGAVFEVT